MFFAWLEGQGLNQLDVFSACSTLVRLSPAIMFAEEIVLEGPKLGIPWCLSVIVFAVVTMFMHQLNVVVDGLIQSEVNQLCLDLST